MGTNLHRLLVQMQAQTDDKIVLISNFSQTLVMFESLCRDIGLGCVKLDGSTATGKRQKLVDRFNDQFSDVRAFLLSSKAGGCGINLIGGKRLVLFDADWNPATDKQALARVWREGQKKRCFIYRFFSTGTMEEKIFQRQLSKEGLQNVVNAEEEKNQFSSSELKALFECKVGATLCETREALDCARTAEDNAAADPPVESRNGIEPQIGFPTDEDLRNWAQHEDVGTVDDPVFVESQKCTGEGEECAVSFVFSCACDEDLVIARLAKEQAEREAAELAAENAAKQREEAGGSISTAQDDDESEYDEDDDASYEGGSCGDDGSGDEKAEDEIVAGDASSDMDDFVEVDAMEVQDTSKSKSKGKGKSKEKVKEVKEKAKKRKKKAKKKKKFVSDSADEDIGDNQTSAHANDEAVAVAVEELVDTEMGAELDVDEAPDATESAPPASRQDVMDVASDSDSQDIGNQQATCSTSGSHDGNGSRGNNIDPQASSTIHQQKDKIEDEPSDPKNVLNMLNEDDDSSSSDDELDSIPTVTKATPSKSSQNSSSSKGKGSVGKRKKSHLSKENVPNSSMDTSGGVLAGSAPTKVCGLLCAGVRGYACI